MTQTEPAAVLYWRLPTGAWTVLRDEESPYTAEDGEST